MAELIVDDFDEREEVANLLMEAGICVEEDDADKSVLYIPDKEIFRAESILFGNRIEFQWGEGFEEDVEAE